MKKRLKFFFIGKFDGQYRSVDNKVRDYRDVNKEKGFIEKVGDNVRQLLVFVCI